MIFVNTFPKGGTGLLRQMMQPFGPDQGHFGMFNGATGKKNSNHNICKIIERAKERDGFYTCHLHWTPQYADALGDTKIILLLRDPRDVILSHAHYVYTTESHHLHEHYMERKFEQPPIMTSMTGIPDLDDEEFPDIAGRFLPYLGWMHHPNTYTLYFEDLKFDINKATRKLARFLGDAEAAPLMRDSIDPSRSATFRKGGVGGWKDEFSDAEKEYYDKHFYWLPDLMGYITRGRQ